MGTAAREAVVETVIDVAHGDIGTLLTLMTTVAQEVTSIVVVDALEPALGLLMVIATIVQVADPGAKMKTRPGIEVHDVSVCESGLQVPNESRPHHNQLKTSEIGERSLCSSWLLD